MGWEDGIGLGLSIAVLVYLVYADPASPRYFVTGARMGYRFEPGKPSA